MMWASPFSHKLSTDTPGFAASITILRASVRDEHKQNKVRGVNGMQDGASKQPKEREIVMNTVKVISV